MDSLFRYNIELLVVALLVPISAKPDTCAEIAEAMLHPPGMSEGKASQELAQAAIAAANKGKVPLLSNSSDLLAEAARLNIAKRSVRYTNLLAQNPNDLEVRTFDTIVVGGGPQTATAASNLKGTRTLVVNDSTDLGTFGKYGDMFYINSREVKGSPSPNGLPGAPTQPSDLADAQTFPPGRVIGNATEIDLAHSDADFLIGDHVVSVGHAPPHSPAPYIIKTDKGNVFYAQNVVILTGLGKRKFPFTDAATLDLVAREQASGNSRIRFIDDFMQDNQALALQGENPIHRYSGKRIVVIGPGDGGAITAESVLGLGPPAGYAYRTAEINKDALPKMVYWIGNNNKTSAEYKKNTFERYWDLVGPMDSGKLENIGAHANRIEEITDGPEKGHFKVYFGPGKDDYRIADEVVVSAGYDNTGPTQMVSGLAADPKAVTSVIIKKDGLNIAKQVMVNGKPENVFFGGAATGGLETEGEPGGFASPRIQVMAKRTAALIKQVRAQIVSPRSCITCDKEAQTVLASVPQTSVQKSVIDVSRSAIRVSSEAEREARIEMRMVSDLSGVRGGPGGPVRIQVVPGPKDLSIQSKDLSPYQLEQVKAIVQKDKDLQTLLVSQSPQKVDRAIEVTLPSDHSRTSFASVKFVDAVTGQPRIFGPSEFNNAVLAVSSQSVEGHKLFIEAQKKGLLESGVLKSFQSAVPYPDLDLPKIEEQMHLNLAQTLTVSASQPMADGAAAFRQDVINQVKAKHEVIANFDGQALGVPVRGGLSSPIAGYSPQEDSVYIEANGHPIWVPLNALYYAMSKIDNATGASRGYIITTPP